MSEHTEEHAHPNYVKIWGLLVLLLIVSVVGPMFGIKVITIITAFGIALVKAYLVAKKFMHVNVEPRFVGAALIATLSLMALFFFMVAPDVMKHEGRNWVNVAAAASIREATEGHEVAAPVEKEPFEVTAVFAKVCAACHGAGGQGDGAASAALNPKPANFTEASFWETRDKESILAVIRDGGASVGKSPMMVAFGSSYNAEELEALAEHVLSLKP